MKTMYVCVLGAAGQVLVHRNVPSTPEALPEITNGVAEGLNSKVMNEAQRILWMNAEPPAGPPEGAS